MNVVLDEEFAKVWSDSRTPIVFSTIRQLPTTLAGLASLCDHHLQLVRKTKKKYRAAYSITDLSSCSPVPLNVAFNYSENFVPKQFRAGLLFKAFIRPRNLSICSANSGWMRSSAEKDVRIGMMVNGFLVPTVC